MTGKETGGFLLFLRAVVSADLECNVITEVKKGSECCAASGITF